jgi:hypothetical protein
VAVGKKVDTDIINATPTVLAMLGVRVPSDMEGRVISEAFDPPLAHEIDTTIVEHAEQPEAGAAAVYSEEDIAKLTERLADLGYLE